MSKLFPCGFFFLYCSFGGFILQDGRAKILFLAGLLVLLAIAMHWHQSRCHRNPLFQSITGTGLSPNIPVRSGFGIGLIVHSGTGMTGCRAVRYLNKIVRKVVQLEGCSVAQKVQLTSAGFMLHPGSRIRIKEIKH
jgi:hypothetical protein